MPIKFQCDVCNLLDGDVDDYNQPIIVEQVVIITLDSEHRKTSNSAKEKIYLCKKCSGPFFKLTRGLGMNRMRDFIEWYRIHTKVNSEIKNDNQGNSEIPESVLRSSRTESQG